MAQTDTAPVFTSGAKIKSTLNEEGETVISFPDAKGFYPAEDYKITVIDKDKKYIFAKTVISDYVRANENDVIVNLGKLNGGEYTVKITAYSPYAKNGGKLTGKISV